MITLRPVKSAEAKALFPLIYETDVTDTLLWNGPQSWEEFHAALTEREEQVNKGEKHIFTVVEEPSGRPIGMADIRPDMEDLRAEVGLWLGIEFQGKGYGTQVVRRLVEYGFDTLGLEKIDGYVFTGNQASRRIFEKNGFLLEGTIRKATRKRGRSIDVWLFGITREDYEQGRERRGNPESQGSPNWIVHICSKEAWEAALKEGEYHTPSLEQEGFIHCSRPEQVLSVANRFYAGLAGLVLLWIDPGRVQHGIRWEPADAQVFPHIYGPLNLDAVLEVRAFSPEADGTFRAVPGR